MTALSKGPRAGTPRRARSPKTSSNISTACRSPWRVEVCPCRAKRGGCCWPRRSSSLATLTGSLLLDRPSEPTVAAVGPKSIAVLPLIEHQRRCGARLPRRRRDREHHHRLSRAPQIRVIARDSVYRYKGEAVDPLSAARELGVETMLSGRVTPRGDRMALTVELIDARDGRPALGRQYGGPPAGCRRSRPSSRSRLPTVSGCSSRTRSGPGSPRLRRGSRRRISCTSRAATSGTSGRQPAARRASKYFYAGGAEGSGLRRRLRRTCGFVRSADGVPRRSRPNRRIREPLVRPRERSKWSDELAEAHTSLAYIKHFYEWDWAGAEREFRRALDLNPNYATAHQWYAELPLVEGTAGRGAGRDCQAPRISTRCR